MLDMKLEHRKAQLFTALWLSQFSSHIMELTKTLDKEVPINRDLNEPLEAINLITDCVLENRSAKAHLKFLSEASKPLEELGRMHCHMLRRRGIKDFPTFTTWVSQSTRASFMPLLGQLAGILSSLEDKPFKDSLHLLSFHATFHGIMERYIAGRRNALRLDVVEGIWSSRDCHGADFVFMEDDPKSLKIGLKCDRGIMQGIHALEHACEYLSLLYNEDIPTGIPPVYRDAMIKIKKMIGSFYRVPNTALDSEELFDAIKMANKYQVSDATILQNPHAGAQHSRWQLLSELSYHIAITIYEASFVSSNGPRDPKDEFDLLSVFHGLQQCYASYKSIDIAVEVSRLRERAMDLAMAEQKA